jgi:quinol monooxygenase YgiN
MPAPTFAIVVTFEIKPNHVDDFRRRIIQQASDSVAREPGCCQFDVLMHESEPNVFVLYESYVDANAFADHKQTAHFHDYDATVAPWILNKQVMRLSMVSPHRNT